MNDDGNVWIDHRGIHQKNGRKHGIVTEVLQQCQSCGRWVYTLTDMTPDGHVCGNCTNRIWRKRKKGAMKKGMKPGDKVIMVDCAEADKNAGRVWTVRSEPWDVCGVLCVLLDGYRGGFAVDCLRCVDADPDTRAREGEEISSRPIQALGDEALITPRKPRLAKRLKPGKEG